MVWSLDRNLYIHGVRFMTNQMGAIDVLMVTYGAGRLLGFQIKNIFHMLFLIIVLRYTSLFFITCVIQYHVIHFLGLYFQVDYFFVRLPNSPTI